MPLPIFSPVNLSIVSLGMDCFTERGLDSCSSTTTNTSSLVIILACSDGSIRIVYAISRQLLPEPKRKFGIFNVKPSVVVPAPTLRLELMTSVSVCFQPQPVTGPAGPETVRLFCVAPYGHVAVVWDRFLGEPRISDHVSPESVHVLVREFAGSEFRLPSL